MGTVILGRAYFQFPEVAARSETDAADLQGRARPGDLLLVRTPGMVYAFGRKLTRNAYDHIAVVLEDGMTLNIVSPRTRILPLACFARANRRPVLLRPGWRSDAQRRGFVSDMEKFDGGPYNFGKTMAGILVSVLYGWLGVPISLKKPESDAFKWICTEAILTRLAENLPEFAEINRLHLDYNSIGFATTNDFYRICRHSPHLLKVV